MEHHFFHYKFHTNINFFIIDFTSIIVFIMDFTIISFIKTLKIQIMARVLHLTPLSLATNT